MVSQTRTIKTSNDEMMTTITEYVPSNETIRMHAAKPIAFLIRGITRDVCGDGTDEYRLNSPAVIWDKFPVMYRIDNSIPFDFNQAINWAFDQFNQIETRHRFYVQGLIASDIILKMAKIDEADKTLAQARWWWNPSTLKITKGEITFDSSESWGYLTTNSCGTTGKVYDIMQVCVHEIGHLSCLAHAPSDKLQTMYPTTGPGVTLGRTLGNGDKLGFKTAYNIPDEPEPEPKPEPNPDPEEALNKAKKIGIMIDDAVAESKKVQNGMKELIDVLEGQLE